MSKQLIGFGLAVAFVAISGFTIKADDRNNNDGNRFAARLTGFQETPTLSTTGRGTFTARLNRPETMIFRGAELPDPERLLEGHGKFMRHVKLGPGRDVAATALMTLIETAYTDMKGRLNAES